MKISCLEEKPGGKNETNPTYYPFYLGSHVPAWK
jgi:hypothetical protein